MRQLLAEALLLASLGTLAGLRLHWYITKLLNELSLPLPVPIAFQIAPDVKLVLYPIALTGISALLAGLMPAWQGTRPGLTSGLKMEEPQYGYRRFTFRKPDCGTGGDHYGVGQCRIAARKEPGPSTLDRPRLRSRAHGLGTS